MFFQTAGIEAAPWIPPLAAFIISFFTSMGGVSGAFLLLPFQMSFLGYTNPSVSATNQVFNIIAIPGGVYRYWREGRLVWPLTAVVVFGTLPGVFIGAVVRVALLPNPRHFKLFAAAVLLYIGWRMVADLLRRASNRANSGSEKRFQDAVRSSKARILSGAHTTHFGLRRLRFVFHGETFDISCWGILLISFFIGIISGIYGIGGGSFVAPILISCFGLPVYVVAGAALMATFVTSIAGVAFYHAIAPFYPDLSVAPDWHLGILFGLGGMAGIYLGARCQKFVPARGIKWMLAAVIAFTSIKYILDFF